VADEDSIPVQTPRAWAHFKQALGSHVPMRVGQIAQSGKRIRAAATQKHSTGKGGK
jgi:hypothetical protein